VERLLSSDGPTCHLRAAHGALARGAPNARGWWGRDREFDRSWAAQPQPPPVLKALSDKPKFAVEFGCGLAGSGQVAEYRLQIFGAGPYGRNRPFVFGFFGEDCVLFEGVPAAVAVYP
jgi:hypothetical protein